MSSRAARSELASAAWLAMYELVGTEDRRQRVRDALDLGPARLGGLLALRDEGPMTLREIATRISIEPSSATVTVDKLEERGLVTRTAHPEDHRRKLVRITEAGRDVADRGELLVAAAPTSFEALSMAELRTLGDLLARLTP